MIDLDAQRPFSSLITFELSDRVQGIVDRDGRRRCVKSRFSSPATKIDLFG